MKAVVIGQAVPFASLCSPHSFARTSSFLSFRIDNCIIGIMALAFATDMARYVDFDQQSLWSKQARDTRLQSQRKLTGWMCSLGWLDCL